MAVINNLFCLDDIIFFFCCNLFIFLYFFLFFSATFRQIRISQAAEPATEADKKKTERRQTGFVRKDDLEKLEIFHKKEDTFVDDNKGDDEADDDVQDHDPKR